MSKTILKCGAIFVLCGGLALAILTLLQERPADRLLMEIASIEMPRSPSGEHVSEEAKNAYKAKQRKVLEHRAELIGDLFKENPDQPELVVLLPQRWAAIRAIPSSVDAFKAEVSDVLARSKDEALVQEASFYQALLALKAAGTKAKPEILLAAIEPHAKKYAKDLRLPDLMLSLADEFEDLEAKIAVYSWVEKTYPNTPLSEQVVIAKARAESEHRISQLQGKPFEMEFTDSIKGTKVSMANLKGKVVVVDFWATWCGPCIEEMPEMKRLYELYKDKGVEFVGISLDKPVEQGGLDRLKEFVAKAGIEWPQYYLGHGFESEFAEKWEVIAIPRMYLVDADGILVTYKARGDLERLIPEYLEKAKKPKS